MTVSPLKVMTVFGTRPDTVKMAPVVRALAAARPAIEPLVCVTAQHREMLDDLLELFNIVPDDDLDIMTADQSLTEITTRVLLGMERVLAQRKPDVVLVHGHTTTSSAAALAAFYRQIPVAHVEAGLRTATRWEPFPEEMNRLLTGRLASYHFAPTGTARLNLERENVEAADIFVTGNTVIDAFLEIAERAERIAEAPEREWHGLDPERPWIFVTAHRRENHDAMPEICRALAEISAFPQHPQILWPVYPSPPVSPIAPKILAGGAGRASGAARCPGVLEPAGLRAARRCDERRGGFARRRPKLGRRCAGGRDARVPRAQAVDGDLVSRALASGWAGPRAGVSGGGGRGGLRHRLRRPERTALDVGQRAPRRTS